MRSHTHAQHFLRSPQLVAELIGHSNIRKNDIVYDLGAGSGVISSALARRCKQVITVEIEPYALKLLENNTANADNVTIVKQDILRVEPQEESYKIFSNIPFNLSADIVRKFVFRDNSPKAMYLIAQKQFARKLVPGSDHFTSELSAEIGPLFSARIRKPLKRTDFTPPPGVDTVLLELKRRDESLLPSDEIARYREWVAVCFHNVAYFRKQPIHATGLSAEITPSQLTLEQWLALWQYKA